MSLASDMQVEGTPATPAVQQEKASVAIKRSRNAGGGDESGYCTQGDYPPAMFNPGRGGELPFTANNLLKPILFKTGENPGPPGKEAFSKQWQQFANQRLSMGFGFKAILASPFPTTTTGASFNKNRFVVHNVFRHSFAAVASTADASAYGPLSTDWNKTLGPDVSFVRKVPPNGSAYSGAAASAGFVDTLKSPYRYPQNNWLMLSRITRITTENVGWNANPIKIKQVSPGTGLLTTVPLQVYDNATIDDGSVAQSLPFQQPQQATVANGKGDSMFYKCQSAKGHLSYSFNNDGTGPVVVDCVITKLKKGQSWDFATNPNAMTDSYCKGYMQGALANRGQAAFGGYVPTLDDPLYNANVTFLPAAALKLAPAVVTIGTGTLDTPFKQVARDQFVISGGATRAWSFVLPSLDYDTRDYPQGTGAANADDITYIVSFGFSSVAVPAVENPTSTSVYAVIDRRANDVNCSVTGTYTETVKPCYLDYVTNNAYIQGMLSNPYFDGTSGVVTATDIANTGQIVRSEAQTSALIKVGPFNTTPGA